MGDAISVFLLTVNALFPIVDPLAGSPILLAMTREYSRETRTVLRQEAGTGGRAFPLWAPH